MEETRYMISDAARKVNVEAHVLRYWEEELELSIPRNEMGHRYYTEEYIHLFRQICQLKENGYQLKAIKMLLPRLKTMNDKELQLLSILSEEMNRQAEAAMEETATEAAPEPEKDVPNIVPMPSTPAQPSLSEDKLVQFQMLMTDVLTHAMQQNSDWFLSQLETRVSDRLLKELNYNMRELEEQQERHFRQIDAALHSRREAAAARVPRRLFSKRQKNLYDEET